MKTKLLLIFSIAGMFFSLAAFAGSGKAIVPHWHSSLSDGLRNRIHVSNITDNTLNVTITLYNKNGSVYNSGLTYTNFITSNTQLAANSSGYLQMYGSTDYGYAVIEWSNTGTDDDVLGLVAYSSKTVVNGPEWRADVGIPVNNGLAF